MNHFQNITQLNNETCKILLYGDIGEYGRVTAADFVQQLDYAAQYYKKARLHIHCPGGDILEAIAIRNTIIASPLEIEIYVDGMAASMGFMIAMCGRKVYMSRWGRLMAHRVSGGGWGNADEILAVHEQMVSLEADLVAMLAEKSGLTTKAIAEKWFNGADHWIKADEALELKIIDGIYDGVAVDFEPATQSLTEIYNHFTNHLKFDTMIWVNFFKRANLKNDATEQEAIDVLDKAEKEAADAKAENDKLKADNDKLKQQLADKEKAEADKAEAEIAEMVNAAVTDGRIVATANGPALDVLKAHYVSMLKSNRAAGEAVLNSLPKGRKLVDELGKGAPGTEPEGSEKWSFSGWQKNAPALLGKMKTENPERFKNLYKAQFGKEPVL